MDFKTAFTKASALCAQQERCCSEIEQKLALWEVEKTDSQKVIAKLLEEKYIDESRFASFYARDKFRFNKWGKQKIVWHLRNKKIPADIITEVISNLDDSDYSETLFSLLKEKEKNLSGREFLKKKAALVRFAASRGFEYDQIMKILDRLL